MDVAAFLTELHSEMRALRAELVVKIDALGHRVAGFENRVATLEGKVEVAIGS